MFLIVLKSYFKAGNLTLPLYFIFLLDKYSITLDLMLSCLFTA